MSAETLMWPLPVGGNDSDTPAVETPLTRAQGASEQARPSSSRQRRRQRASLMVQDLGPLQTASGSLLGV